MKPVSKSILQKTAKLKQKKFRDLQGQYIVSGLNAVQGALDSPREPIAIFSMQGREHLLDELPAPPAVTVYSATEKEFRHISDEKVPQGIALLMERPPTGLDTLKLSNNMVLYLEEINDPGNLGTIIRSALWFGVDTILLSPDSADPYQPKVVRASAGAVTQMNLYEQVRSENLNQLKNELNIQIAATVVNGGSALDTFVPSAERPLLIALGSEAHGVSDALLKLSDVRLTIPRKGRGESLNLGVSAALCLYELTRSK